MKINSSISNTTLKNKNTISQKKANIESKEEKIQNNKQIKDDYKISTVIGENLRALELGTRDLAIKNPGVAFSQIAQHIKPMVVKQVANKSLSSLVSKFFFPVSRAIQLTLDYAENKKILKSPISDKLDKTISKGRLLTDAIGLVGAIGSMVSIPYLTALSPVLIAVGLVGDIASTSYFATKTAKTTTRQIIDNFKRFGSNGG